MQKITDKHQINKIWDNVEERLIKISTMKCGEYVPAAGLAIGILVQAGRDNQLAFLESEIAHAYALLSKVSVRELCRIIINTQRYIDGKIVADFDFGDITL